MKQIRHKLAMARLVWSKNVNEEQQAPWQHLFGCMDWMFCVLLNVGLWLGIFHSDVADGCICPFVFAFTDEMNDLEKAVSHTQTKVYTLLHPTLTLIGLDADCLLGSHGIHKFVLTHSRGNGFARMTKITKADRRELAGFLMHAMMHSWILLMPKLLLCCALVVFAAVKWWTRCVH